jgi:hypothetical protein
MTDITIDFANLCTVRTSRYDVVHSASSDTVKIVFHVQSDKTHAFKEYTSQVPFSDIKSTRQHERDAWLALMDVSGVEIVTFVREEVLKPSSMATFDPII